MKSNFSAQLSVRSQSSSEVIALLSGVECQHWQVQSVSFSHPKSPDGKMLA